MSDGHERTERDAGGGARGARLGSFWSRLPGWKRLLLIAATVLMVGGAALQGVAAFGGGDDRAAPTAAPSGGAPGIVSGFAAAGDEGEAAPAAGEAPVEGLGAWSPSIFRLGFSFFAGFAMAIALRSVLKLALIAIGLLLLALVGLQYAGLVDVNWSRMSEQFDGSMAWLQGQFGSIKTLLTGYLPSAASGATGLVVGFRRN